MVSWEYYGTHSSLPTCKTPPNVTSPGTYEVSILSHFFSQMKVCIHNRIYVCLDPCRSFCHKSLEDRWKREVSKKKREFMVLHSPECQPNCNCLSSLVCSSSQLHRRENYWEQLAHEREPFKRWNLFHLVLSWFTFLIKSSPPVSPSGSELECLAMRRWFPAQSTGATVGNNRVAEVRLGCGMQHRWPRSVQHGDGG